MAKPQKHKSMWKKDASRVLIIVTIFVVALLLLRWEPVRANLFDVVRLRDSLGPDDSPLRQLKSSIIFAAVGTLLVGLGMPRLWVSVAAGGVFGAVLGTTLALISSVLGSIITYLVGRSLLGSVIRRRLGKYPRFARVRSHLERNAFLFTLSMRLFPFSNTTLTSLFCGSCKVPLGPYTIATIIGFLPLTIVFATFGSGTAKAQYEQILLGVVMLLIVVLVQRFLAPKMDDEISSTSADEG